MENKIKKTYRFSSDLCEKLKGYALMENKSETQFVTDCINDHIGRETSTDSFISEMKKVQTEIKKLRLEIQKEKGCETEEDNERQ